MEFKRDNKFIRLIFHYYSELSDENYYFDTSKLDILKIHDILSREQEIVNDEGNIKDILEVKIMLGRPGMLIGKGGRDFNALNSSLSESTGRNVKIILEDFNLWEYHKI